MKAWSIPVDITDSLTGLFLETSGDIYATYAGHTFRVPLVEDHPYLLNVTNGIAIVAVEKKGSEPAGIALIDTFTHRAGPALPVSYESVKQSLQDRNMLLKLEK